MARGVLLCLCVAIVGCSAYRIGVSPWDPMVVCNISGVETSSNDGKFSGYSVELIREIARKIGWARSEYEIVCLAWDPMMAALVNGTLDFVLSGVSITGEDALKYSFAQPEYLSGLKLLVKNTDSSQTARPFSFFDPFDLTLWLVFLATTVVLANLYWLFELSLGNDSEVHDKYLHGFLDTWFYVMNGFVGEDPFIEIRTYMARIVQMAYKFMVVILLATYTGSVSAIITLKQQNNGISGPSEIGGKLVATSTLQDNENALRMYGAIPQPNVWGTNDAGYAMVDKLKRGDVDAVALDGPFVDYVAAHDCSVRVAGSMFNLQNYGPTFRNNSEHTTLFQQVNFQIIDMQISGYLEFLAAKYMPESQCSTEDSADNVKFIQVFGLWIILGGAILLAFLLLAAGMIFYRRKSMFKNWREAFHMAGHALSEAASEDGSAENDEEKTEKTEKRPNTGDKTKTADIEMRSVSMDMRGITTSSSTGALERKIDALEATVRQLIVRLDRM